MHDPVDTKEASAALRATCNEVGACVTRMHPLVPRLGHAPTQAVVLRALFEITKQVEVIKKHLLKLEKGDGSSLL